VILEGRIKMRLLSLGAGLFAACVASVASATTVAFDNFASTAGLTLNGFTTPVANDGAGDTNVLELQPSGGSFVFGTVFSNTQLQASSGFSTEFQWRMNGPVGISDGTQVGADGLVFTVQTESSSAGQAGEGIGYQGITPSVGVKFDTFQNTVNNDPSSNYIGVATDGDINNADFPGGQTNVATQFDNGSIWTGWVDYNGSSLSVYAVDANTTVKPSSPLLTYAVNIPEILGQSNAFIGFTSADGASSENTYLLDWTYFDFFNPTGTGGGGGSSTAVPLPSAVWMGLGMLGGLGLIGFVRSRAKRVLD
jgi:hypothetical protein